MRSWTAIRMDDDLSGGWLKKAPPLVQAVAHNRLSLIDALVAAGESLDSVVARRGIDNRTVRGWSALIAAAAWDRREAAKKLLAAGADPSLKDKEGNTAVWHAWERGHSEILAMLPPDSIGADGDDGEDGDTWEDEPLPPLLGAVQEGDADSVRDELATGAAVDTCAPGGYTGLHLAAVSDHVEIAASLLAAGADPSLFTDEEHTPLMVAILADSDAVLTLLLEHGAAPDVRDSQGFTALILAAQEGKVGAVKALVQHGADLNARTDSGRTTPLLAALRQKRDEVAAFLIDAGAEIPARDKADIIDTTLKHGLARTIQALLERGIDLDPAVARLKTAEPPAIMVAALEGNLALVRLLVEAGFDTEVATPMGFTPLLLAASGGHHDIVEFLVSKGADPRSTTRVGAGLLGIWLDGKGECSGDALQRLIDLGASPSDEVENPLTILSRRPGNKPDDDNDGFSISITPEGVTAEGMASTDALRGPRLDLALADCARVLLAAGAGVNGAQEVEIDHGVDVGTTPLIMAVRQEFPQLARVLIEAGATPDPIWPFDWPPCQVFIEVPRDAPEPDLPNSIVVNPRTGETILWKAGVNMGPPPRLLYFAIHLGSAKLVRLLLEHGASPHPEPGDGQGEPPILWAAVMGNAEIVRALIKHGASPNHVMKARGTGTYPLLEAVRHTNPEMVAALLDGGSKLVMDDDIGPFRPPLAEVLSRPDKPGPGVDSIASGPDGDLLTKSPRGRPRQQICRLLLAHGADPDGLHDGRAVIDIAADAGFSEGVTVLLEHGAAPAGASSDGTTPLLRAIGRDDVAVVHALVEGGASRDAQGTLSELPLAVAKKTRAQACARLLRHYG